MTGGNLRPVAARVYRADAPRQGKVALVTGGSKGIGAATAVYGIIQYGLLHYDNLGQRPQGTLSHYMTYSGVLMLVICAAVGKSARLYEAGLAALAEATAEGRPDHAS